MQLQSAGAGVGFAGSGHPSTVRAGAASRLNLGLYGLAAEFNKRNAFRLGPQTVPTWEGKSR